MQRVKSTLAERVTSAPDPEGGVDEPGWNCGFAPVNVQFCKRTEPRLSSSSRPGRATPLAFWNAVARTPTSEARRAGPRLRIVHVPWTSTSAPVAPITHNDLFVIVKPG